MCGPFLFSVLLLIIIWCRFFQPPFCGRSRRRAPNGRSWRLDDALTSLLRLRLLLLLLLRLVGLGLLFVGLPMAPPRMPWPLVPSLAPVLSKARRFATAPWLVALPALSHRPTGGAEALADIGFVSAATARAVPGVEKSAN